MSRIKSYLLGFIILCITSCAFGQDQIDEPLECKTPSGVVSSGGDFSLSNAVACLSYSTSQSKVQIVKYSAPDGGPFTPGTTKFIFNFKDSMGQPMFPNIPTFDTTYTKPGFYWIMMRGQKGGTEYIKCKRIEVLKTQKLQLDYDACSASSVTIKILPTADNQTYSAFSVDWGDGNVQEYPMPNSIPGAGIPITHNYSGSIINPKIQGLHKRGGDIVCFGDTYLVEIVNTSIPKITELEGLNGGSEDKLTIKGGNPGTEYLLEMKTGSGAWTSTGKKITAPAASATASETITGLSGTNEYCFRLQKPGSCATQITSNEVCTIKPTHTVLSPKAVKVDWTTAQTGITRFQIPYKESPSGNNQNSGSTQPSVMTYTFDQMSCGTKYEFRVIGYVGTIPDRVEIKSPTFIVDPATGGRLPSSLIGIASVDNNTVSINMFSTLTINKYNIYRAEGNSTNFQPLTTVTTNAYIDRAVEQDKQQYCYKVDYEDDCGNRSDLSEPFCTIFLTSAESNTLNWTPFSVTGSPTVLQNVQATEYTIQIIDQHGTVLSTPGNTFETMADVKDALDRLLNDPALNGRVTFRILAMQDAELILPTGPLSFPFFSYSNNYTFITPAQIYVPSAFTPNMDTVNDSFKATGKFIAQFNMIIYNRWGAPIFESQNIDLGWDGNENGTPAPAGSYGYKIFGIDNAGQEFSKLGSVLLLK